MGPTKSTVKLPPVDCFQTLPTFGKWLPMACRDIAALLPYSTYYRAACPSQLVINNSGGPFFFLNHPINYVVVTGKCVHFEHKYYSDSETHHYIYTVDDDTGATVIARTIRHSYDAEFGAKKMLGKYVEIRGYIAQSFTGPVIYIRDLHILTQRQKKGNSNVPVRSLSPFERFLLASEEVLIVRRELLCKQWESDQRYRASPDVESSPSLFCSFSRTPSCLGGSNLFIESIKADEDPPSENLENQSLLQIVGSGPTHLTNTKKMNSDAELENGDTQTDYKEVQISPNVSIRIPAGGGLEIVNRNPKPKSKSKSATTRPDTTKEETDARSELSVDGPNDNITAAVKCATPRTGSIANTLIRSVIKRLYRDHRELSTSSLSRGISGSKKNRVHSRTSPSSRIIGKPAVRPLPLPLAQEAASAELLSLVAQFNAKSARFETLNDLFNQIEESQSPYSLFVSQFSDIFCDILHGGRKRTRSFLSILESQMEELFTQLVLDSASVCQSNKVVFVMEMVQFARDAMFLFRVKHSVDDLATLGRQLADPEASLYEGIPRDLLMRFLENGLQSLCDSNRLSYDKSNGTFEVVPEHLVRDENSSECCLEQPHKPHQSASKDSACSF